MVFQQVVDLVVCLVVYLVDLSVVSKVACLVVKKDPIWAGMKACCEAAVMV